MNASLIDTLRALVGAAQVLQGEGLDAYEIDWRKRYRGRALAVVRPADAAEVAAVVRACVAAGVAIVPQGGNTGLVGGGVPDGSGQQVLLSLARLNRIREIDTDNLTLTAEAGCVLQAVQQAADEGGLLFPLSLAAEGSCTIGGNLASNAGGTQVLRYGNARELCLGLEVVTPKGELWAGLSGLRKNNTGYDLRDLFIGSEGTLGIITAATLKLFPKPAATVTALAACDSVEAAVGLLNLARARLGPGLTGFELMQAFAMSLVERHFPQLPKPLPGAAWTVLLELAGTETEEVERERLSALLELAVEREMVSDAVIAASISQSRALWHLRESIPLAQSEEGLNIKHDIALPVSAIPGFVTRMAAQLQQAAPGARVVCFGHLGDGNLHYNLQAPEGIVADEFLAAHEGHVNELVYDEVLRLGGSFSAEHGIGALKREELAQRSSPVALGMMRAIKAALDPAGLLNPGRVV
ncbi:MAG TPA: FAD-binding oxidoreductase [Ideonella sp.]|uniref:FAD-binding oxidoreductase n=1 Tax=Ideonella sp. TaxID=1929293 RepID=UPI002E37C703|nr:FAD-binding oxidoreductase [Ideonella sp.]HEX5685982.1 FAD-binding oxidoreductase [Ideonella sp.]